MTEPATPQQFTFQAEISRLLHLLSHSLYQNREIAIRELVSNASDALDKFRHVVLMDKKYDDGVELRIDVKPNAETKILSIIDNGIGMTRDELIQNLGTIAHSGSLDFLTKNAGDNQDLSLIGQFGVGFYSSFMLADKVEVITRSYREDAGWRWESDGSGTFVIEPQEVAARGTEIRLHLKRDMDEFSRSVRLQWILRTYSTFLAYPIFVDAERVNDQRPIWVEPKSQVTLQQYRQFFSFIAKRSEEEMSWHLHLTLDSPFQFHAILFCPTDNQELLGMGRIEHGLHLCAKRVSVQDNCQDLLPVYLRFLFGLVDSADLPLNVSREALQDNSVFRKIRKTLTKRVLSHLEEMAKDNVEDYRKFWLQFGSIMREGIAADFENRDQIARLLRYKSSHGDDREVLVGLDDYVSRMKEGQTELYFASGPDVRSIERNPNLEAFRSRNVEVLYLTDPIDEFVINNLYEFSAKRFVSIEDSNAKVAEIAQQAAEQKPEEEKTEDKIPDGFDRVVTLFKEALGDRVEDIRASDRLTSSVACLVSKQGSFSAALERVLNTSSQEFKPAKRVLEINPKHPLITRLVGLPDSPDNIFFIKNCGQQIHSNLMLLDGVLPDPHETADRMLAFMSELAQKR